jgi:predicted  nucleic acid-binding Zn-ribbon protein|tara:strand:+ start:718 stop:1062 length:345 start_codon:yes stop_codon:yes gene_type:complete
MANEEIQKIELVTRTLEESVVTPIKEANEEISQLVNVFGQLYLRRKELEDELVKLDEGVEKAEADFKEKNEAIRGLVNELEQEYPRGQLDLQKGTITFDPSMKEKMAEQMEVVK